MYKIIKCQNNGFFFMLERRVFFRWVRNNSLNLFSFQLIERLSTNIVTPPPIIDKHPFLARLGIYEQVLVFMVLTPPIWYAYWSLNLHVSYSSYHVCSTHTANDNSEDITMRTCTSTCTRNYFYPRVML